MSPAASATGQRESADDASNLNRSANALVLGVVVTTGLGFFYWVAAARLYDADVVGKASALIGAMTFLTTAATLGLTNGLVRFLPATSAAGRLIRNAYMVSALAGAFAAIVFLLGQPLWADELEFVRATPLAATFFILATSAWVIFVLQDSVLTGLHHARWVPVYNGGFAVAKLVALVALTTFGVWGVFVSWTVPAIAVLAPVNWYVFRRVLPKRARHRSHRRLRLRDLAEFAARDYVASLFWMGTTQLMPLIVLSRLSAEASATYYVSFSIAYALYLMTISVGSAYLAEASRHPTRAPVLLRRAARQATILVVPASLVGVVVAPLALSLYGADYSQHGGATLLRLVIASAIPQVVIGLTLADARQRGDTRLVVAVYGITAVAVLGTSFATIGRFGLVAVGWSWLLTQTILAVVLLRRRRVDVSREGLALAVDIRRQVRVLRSRRRLHAVTADVETALRVADPSRRPGTRLRLLASDNSTLVIDGGDCVVRVAEDAAATRALANNASALRGIAADHRLGKRRGLFPLVLAEHDVGDRHITVESQIDGTSVDRLGTRARREAVRRVAAVLATVNEATRSKVECGDEEIERLVTQPLARVRTVPWLSHVDAELAAVGEWLEARLRGRELVVGRTHGDPWVANALARESERARLEISGIVDWEDSSPDGLLDIDLFLLWFSTSGRELGDAVNAVLADPHAADRSLREVLGRTRPNQRLEPCTAAMLAWLHHVDAQLSRNSRAGRHRVWLERNVVAVATAAATRPDPLPGGHVVAALPGTSPRQSARAWVTTHAIPLAATAAAAIAWSLASIAVDVEAMDDYGLISVLNVGHAVAFALLAASFVWSLHRHRSELLLGLHIVVLVGMWQITPALLYDTLRYAWAWKHTGIVEYLLREGRVDTTVAISPIYHAWPGFFAGSGLLTEAIGSRSAVTLATWTPLVLDLMAIAALRALLRTFTADVRVLWLAMWLYVLANWVGQDYFAPQGTGFVLYLVLLALVLRSEDTGRHQVVDPAPRTPRLASRILLTVLALAIASSHQITPLMMILSIAALGITRVIHVRFALSVAIVTTVGWAFTIGRGYVVDTASEVLDEFGDPLSSTSATLDRSAFLNDAQRIVSFAGRLIVVMMVILALVGVVRQWQRGRFDVANTALMLAPGVLIVVTPFGGEVLFRAFLFAVPFLALAAAKAVFPDAISVEHRRSGLAVAVLTALLVPCFVLAYFGKDRQYSFTNDEVAAVTWLYEHAPAGSTIVEGSTNGPRQFLRYEQFIYVPIAEESETTRDAVLENPTFTLGDWLADESVPAVYLLLTRSQAIDVDSVGPMPAGAIQQIEDDILDSPRFEVVFENRDAVVIQLARRT